MRLASRWTTVIVTRRFAARPSSVPFEAIGSARPCATSFGCSVVPRRTSSHDARVWIGFHFRNSVEQGLKLGNNVADWTLDRYFQPVHP